MKLLWEIREEFAREVTRGIRNDAVLRAFATVKREDFVGPPPWAIKIVKTGEIDTHVNHPAPLYQDALVLLSAERGINNGQPSLHALCLAACDPKPGETVLHVGAGTGYYSAILAELVGSTGSVAAYEIEQDLAERARGNLAAWKKVSVVAGSGCEGKLPNADVIYVNAGASQPMPNWLEALKLGGRLIFPLTADSGIGCMLLVTRSGENSYAAKVVSRAVFIPCVGARDEEMSERLEMAFRKGGFDTVRSLRPNDRPDETAWCVGKGWWISTV